MSARAELIEGLRGLADWLEANPAAPWRQYDVAGLQHSADLQHPNREAAMEALDGAGEALGLPVGPLHSDGDMAYYGFRKAFGPVRYVAVSIADDEKEATS